LGYFIFSENQDEPPKVAQLVKSSPISNPNDDVVQKAAISADNDFWKKGLKLHF
jgi:hypothetical protein